MRDALINVSGRFEGVDGRRVVVLITDAYDEHSVSSLDDAVAAARQAGVTVYAVGIGGVAGISLKGHDELKAIAAGTGGRVFFPPRPAELANVYDVLAADAQLRYLITYTPTNQRRDGTWRKVSLKTYADGLVVKARNGYYAPAPPPVRPALEFTAMDLESNYLELTKDDLVVLEDGVEQKIDTFREATAPVSMVLALDSSGSMKRVSDKVVEAAATFVEALRPEDSLGMISFANKSMVSHGVTTDRDVTLQELAKYTADGGTALYDALCDSLLMLKQRNGRRAVVVVTDGRDEDNPGTGPGSKRTWEDVQQLLQDVDVTVFSVGLGTKIDADRLAALARFSSGQAYFPEEVSELAEQVPENHREPSAPVHHRLHFDQRGARRRLARRGDPVAGVRRRDQQPPGLFRTRSVSPLRLRSGRRVGQDHARRETRRSRAETRPPRPRDGRAGWGEPEAASGTALDRRRDCWSGRRRPAPRQVRA